ncbi:hypothetical protein B0H67DRAFT_650016 [Lasiosphaeris hirsuta]|uniref:Uncharacterized protein n=1 Tax=Lasiosphaeris hirsuta TaxID=260670 RepID=A0AA40DLJ4_9PEZI|nr:hypothetical protein B0H67DRAFT_650016 [Lasiosphaeris hirsuta]
MESQPVLEVPEGQDDEVPLDPDEGGVVPAETEAGGIRSERSVVIGRTWPDAMVALARTPVAEKLADGLRGLVILVGVSSLVLASGVVVVRGLVAYQGTGRQAGAGHVAVSTVELAVTVLVVFLVYLAAVGLAAFWFVVVRRLPPGAAVTRTKVKWMAQSMRESSGREVDLAYLGASWGELWADLSEAKPVTLRSVAEVV